MKRKKFKKQQPVLQKPADDRKVGIIDCALDAVNATEAPEVNAGNENETDLSNTTTDSHEKAEANDPDGQAGE